MLITIRWSGVRVMCAVVWMEHLLASKVRPAFAKVAHRSFNIRFKCFFDFAMMMQPQKADELSVQTHRPKRKSAFLLASINR